MASPHRVKALTAALAALALAATAAACGGSGGGKAASEDDLATITAMVPLLGSQAPAADSELQQAIEKFAGKKLQLTWVPNTNYGDRTTVTLASDNLPEVMVVQGKSPSFVQSAEAGAFWDLTDRLDDYPNLTAENKRTLLNSSINGKNYGIFRLRDPIRSVVILRKDWLAKLGLKEPETVDDLYRVAKAFTENDPDGNGKKDTYGMIIPSWGGYGSASPYDIIETWFGAPNAWGERDGKLVPGFDSEAFLEANRFVKKMIDEGLINRDFATMDSATWDQPFFNGQGGIIIDVASRAGVLTRLFKEKDPKGYGDYVTMTGNLLGPDGERHSYPTTGYNGFLAISKQSVPTEEELTDVLKVLDKLSSKEGQDLLNNGIEGRNYTVKDGKALATPGDDAAVEVIRNDRTSFAQLGTQSNGYLGYPTAPAGEPERLLEELRLELHARDLKTAVHNPAQPLVSKTYATKGAQLDQIVADARVKFLAGQLDEAGLKAEIQRWHREGGDQVIEEMTELYAKVK